MQRHGGSRPAGEPAAKAATKAGAATPAREGEDENNRRDADAGTAPEKSNDAKN
jgi:hypothetical protein